MKKCIIICSLILVSQFAFTQTTIDNSFFDKVDLFLKMFVKNGNIDYPAIQSDKRTLNELSQLIATASLDGVNDNTQQAFLINAYNILVIDEIIAGYPLNSVLEKNGFFDYIKRTVAGQKMTLNQLEKDYLLKAFNDPRFHFVLVCGAKDCPPIINFAYRPEQLDAQLDAQTRQSLNNPNFIKVDSTNSKVNLSQIFEWYANDFGGNKKTALAFINQYRENKIPESYGIGFYNYDWALNIFNKEDSLTTINKSNNDSRYIVSAARPKGTTETKWFNNLYTQQFGTNEARTNRSTFFTSLFSFLYGVTNKFNAGFDLRYRRVRNEALPSDALNIFSGSDPDNLRGGITSIGPKIRWAPIEALPNFSIQSAFWFQLGEDLEGANGQPFLDWDGNIWWTQFFNDIPIGSNFSVFAEVDVLIEDMGKEADGASNRFSTPATLIFSYFPNPKTTIYALGSYSPFWQENYDYFAQGGVGAKYQFTPNFELELLYTAFTNDFLNSINGAAATYNLGIRITK